MTRDWINDRRMETEAIRFRALRSNYEVRIESGLSSRLPR